MEYVSFLVFEVIFRVFLIFKFEDFYIYMVVCWKVSNMEFILICIKYVGVYFVNGGIIFNNFSGFYN